jgi:hypothetical protein
MNLRDESLPDWIFHVEEVSAGVYEVSGEDSRGRSVTRKGTDPDGLLTGCKRDAAELDQGAARDG